MRLCLSLAFAVVAAGFATSPVIGQPTCTASTSNEWLRGVCCRAPGVKLSEDRVVTITDHMDEAIAQLERRSFMELSADEVVKFTGQAALASSKLPLRAYLVRAVYPTGNPVLDIRIDAGRLDVAAFGLGCAPYAKHPIVLFLDQPPEQVNVEASAAL